MTITNQLLRHAIKPEQGVGFYLMPETMPMPEFGGGGLLIYDAYSQLHGLVLDADTGLWYDITTRNGPTGYGLTKYWTDKDGAQFDRIVKFREDTSESEEKPLRTDVGFINIRPTKELNRNQSGYDAKGYPTGLEIDLDLYTDGEPTTPTTTIKDVPENGALKTDRKVSGNRIQLGLTANRGDHFITNRLQKYISSENPELTVSNELEYQEDLAGLLYWLSVYNQSIINRITGALVTISGATVVAGPSSIAETGIQFTGTIACGNVAPTTHKCVTFWGKGTLSLQFLGSGVSLTTLRTVGDWTLYYSAVPNWATGAMTIVSTGEASISDLRVYDNLISSAAQEYYYNDIENNAGGIVLP